jgi:hypothetical protein
LILRVWDYVFSIVEASGIPGGRQLAVLRSASEFQLYALLFALPFEYYFRAREQTLFTSLKLQILLFVLTWISVKLAEALRSERAIRSNLTWPLNFKLLLAIALFVLVQVLAAAATTELCANALRAAVKTLLGALLAIAAADLVVGFRPRHPEGSDALRNSEIALSVSSGVTALLGLSSLFGIGASRWIVHLFQGSEYVLGNRVRFLSTMEHPNTAGALLSASFCATLALGLFPGPGRFRRWNAAWLVLAAVEGSALVLTLSRGAVASTILAILIATWILRQTVSGAQKLRVMAACFVVMLGGASGLYLARPAAKREAARAESRLARWGLSAAKEVRYLLPGHTYREAIAVRNTSPSSWRGGGCGISYRWYSLSNRQTLPLVVGTAFETEVAPRQEARMPVSLVTPSGPGEYLLIYFVICDNPETGELKGSFSPGVLCVIDTTVSKTPRGISDLARGYLASIRDERRHLDRAVDPGRLDLWRAALRMSARSPLLGMGPDNFRLLKVKYMDFPTWDEKILANNLYLEMLSGSGILGLASFLWLLWEFGQGLATKVVRAKSASDLSAAYFGVAYFPAFVLHGIVDYFLKFTPTFLLFWLLLGMLCARGRTDRGTYANRV